MISPNPHERISSQVADEVAEATKGGERKPGVVLMGLGLYSRGELGPALRKTKVCRLAGVITGSRGKGLEWSRDHGFPQKNVCSYETMHQIADNPDVDVVYVVTPNSLHLEHTVAMARAGKHVICEKPMASTAAECDTMLAACAKANVRLSIGYRLHYDPYHIELDRLAREKDFGTLDRLSGEHSWALQTRAWRIEKALSGGGPLMDVGIYVIQAACRAAMALPVAVTARELQKTKPELFNQVEETIEWTMEFPNRVTCTASSSYARNRANFRAEGDKGWIHLDSAAYAYRGIVAATSRGPLHYQETPQQALHMDDFRSPVSWTGREPPVGGDHGALHHAWPLSTRFTNRRPRAAAGCLSPESPAKTVGNRRFRYMVCNRMADFFIGQMPEKMLTYSQDIPKKRMENLREATASKSRIRVTAKVQTFVLDTNVLIHDPQSIYKFEENNLAIPVEVLEELDAIKTEQSTERGRNARRVHRITAGAAAGTPARCSRASSCRLAGRFPSSSTPIWPTQPGARRQWTACGRSCRTSRRRTTGSSPRRCMCRSNTRRRPCS